MRRKRIGGIRPGGVRGCPAAEAGRQEDGLRRQRLGCQVLQRLGCLLSGASPVLEREGARGKLFMTGSGGTGRFRGHEGVWGVA